MSPMDDNPDDEDSFPGIRTPPIGTQGFQEGNRGAISFPRLVEEPSLEPYIGKLERFELFSTNQCYYLVGGNKMNTVFRILKMDRTLIERPQQQATRSAAVRPSPETPTNIPNGDSETTLADSSHAPKPTLRPLSDFLTEDPQVYSQDEIRDMLDMIHDGNRMRGGDARTGDGSGMGGGGLKPIVKAYGIVGFIRFLDCYYLTLITRRAKVGSIGGNSIYTIKNTETVPLKPAERSPMNGSDDNADPSSVLLSMWNRGKRSVGLGLTNREIAELRYQGLYQVMDLSKNFFFSYTYDLTRSLQGNFLLTATRPFPPPPPKEMFSWNHFLTREFEACLDPATSFYWLGPIVHGSFVQRRVNDYGRVLDITLLARRSRHFAGTRYLKRGVNEQGKVANDVEHEQILHDDSRMPSGVFCSFLQVRGSIPTFWTQESSVTMPKPPIILNRIDPTYTATRVHFEDLLKRYSSPVIVLDLVKQSEKREREVRVGNEYRRAIDYINTTIDDAHKIRYCACDYSHISKHRHLDVSSSLNEVSTWAVNQTGFFCSSPKWKITKGGIISPFTEDDMKGSSTMAEWVGVKVFPMEQSGILRTNCIDCLDRTNVAQFSAGVEAMSQQLVVMGIRSRSNLSSSSNIVRVLIDMYVEIGDNIALQYGGSEAHKKVTAERSELNITGPIGKHKELLTSIRRYYSNAFTDRLKQDAMNLFLGNYLPFKNTTSLWDMETDFYLHNYNSNGGSGNWCSMGTYQRAYGVAWKNDTCDRTVSTISSPRESRGLVVSGRRVSEKQPIDEETKTVQLVRSRLEAQKDALSLWWKQALQVNLQQRMWIRNNRGWPESEVRPRFERIYQPESLSQYDRYFSRAWSTPVRRSHALQHEEGGTEEAATGELVRIVTRTAMDNADQRTNEPGSGRKAQEKSTLKQFTSKYGYEPWSESSLRRFSEYHSKRTKTAFNTSFVGSLMRDETSRRQQYARYLASNENADSPHHFKEDKIQEFEMSLHDYHLRSDDVSGIQKLNEESHLGETIRYGMYEGLSKHDSGIEVATVIHEQLNATSSGGQRVVERELRRRGVCKVGVKDAVSNGLRHFTSAEKQYNEILDFSRSACRRSDLTTTDSLKLYCSEFDAETELSVVDQIFLLSRVPDNFTGAPRNRGASSEIRCSSEPSPLVEKAARLGIAIKPSHEVRRAVVPTIYSRERRHVAPEGFEQINDDLYSRKDNKYMVFNGAAVESWEGAQPMTKLPDAGGFVRLGLPRKPKPPPFSQLVIRREID